MINSEEMGVVTMEDGRLVATSRILTMACFVVLIGASITFSICCSSSHIAPAQKSRLVGVAMAESGGKERLEVNRALG